MAVALPVFDGEVLAVQSTVTLPGQIISGGRIGFCFRIGRGIHKTNRVGKPVIKIAAKALAAQGNGIPGANFPAGGNLVLRGFPVDYGDEQCIEGKASVRSSYSYEILVSPCGKSGYLGRRTVVTIEAKAARPEVIPCYRVWIEGEFRVVANDDIGPQVDTA